jgi:nucleoside-diphosphate kinase
MQCLNQAFINSLVMHFDRIYSEGLFVAHLRFGTVTRQTASQFYAEHEGKPFYESLVKYITSGPIVAMELVGKMQL